MASIFLYTVARPIFGFSFFTSSKISSAERCRHSQVLQMMSRYWCFLMEDIMRILLEKSRKRKDGRQAAVPRSSEEDYLPELGRRLGMNFTFDFLGDCPSGLFPEFLFPFFLLRLELPDFTNPAICLAPSVCLPSLEISNSQGQELKRW